MTIIAARRYRAGIVVEADLAACPDLPGSDEFDWIGIVEPNARDISWVVERYGLHPLAVEDALTPRHAPKVEAYGDQLFVIARTAEVEGPASIHYGQTAIFLGERFIITLRLGSARAHVALRQQLEAHPKQLSQGPDFVLHALLAFIVDGYEPVVDHLETVIGEMEEHVIGAFPVQEQIRQIFHLRRRIRRFEGLARRMEEMAAKLGELEQPAIDKQARPYFRDVYDNARRASYRIRGLNDTLGSILEVAGLLEQNRQGVITRQLAAWAAILAVPTAIAGIYGMNFQFMPELTWHYGYYAIVGAMLTTCIGLYLRFRRIGWL